MGVNQNALTPNFPHLLDEQARHIADVVGEAKLRQAQVIEPTAEAEAGWVQTIRDTAAAEPRSSAWPARPATTTAKARKGVYGGLFSGLYGAGPVAFDDLVRTGAQPGMKGLQFA